MNQPEIHDAIVVGAGIIGLMVARELLHQGLRVRMVDKAFSGPVRTHVGEMCHLGGDPALTSLYAHGLDCWRNAGTRYGSDFGLAVRGAADLATSAGRVTMLSAEAQGETNTGFAGMWVPAGEALNGQLGTQLGETVRGAKWWGDAPVLSTHTALETLRRDLVAKGLLVWGQDDVVELMYEDDRMTGVRVASGETALANHVILTTGTAAGRLLKQVGPHLPLRPARTHILTLSDGGEIGFPMLVHRLRRGHVWMKRTREGPLLVAYDGLMDPMQATFSQKPDPRIISALVQHVGQLVPAMANAGCSQTTVHTAAVTPDFRPAIGLWPDVKGLVVATGFGARSYSMAAGTARLVAQMVKGEQTSIDVAPFAPNRFMVGTWQKVSHPKSLSWKEPLSAAQPQLVGGQKETDYMNNVNLVEKPDAKFASNVKQIEKKMITAASSGKKKEEAAPSNSLFPNSRIKAASVGKASVGK